MPKTEDLISFFTKKGLKIKSTIVPSNDSFNRSRAREKQLIETDAKWIIFVDADMVYSPNFFSEMKTKLECEQFCNETKCIGADRTSLGIPFCKKYFDEDKSEYPFVVENVSAIVSKWPVYRTGGKHTAAGYFQMGNVASIRERKLTYPIKGRDGARTYKADRAFRCIMGGRIGMDLPNQYHLNHDRCVGEFQR